MPESLRNNSPKRRAMKCIFQTKRTPRRNGSEKAGEEKPGVGLWK
jgi:hypothetical protein